MVGWEGRAICCVAASGKCVCGGADPQGGSPSILCPQHHYQPWLWIPGPAPSQALWRSQHASQVASLLSHPHLRHFQVCWVRSCLPICFPASNLSVLWFFSLSLWGFACNKTLLLLFCGIWGESKAKCRLSIHHCSHLALPDTVMISSLLHIGYSGFNWLLRAPCCPETTE